jgi:glycine C-acetyltransferase
LLRSRIAENATQFRSGLSAAGFQLLEGNHPIIPVMVGEAGAASALASALMEEAVYVRAFSFPVVPRGKARIRTQMSAALNSDQIELAIAAFTKAGRKTGIIS